MSITGAESIGPVLQQAQKLVSEGPGNLKEFDDVLSKLGENQQMQQGAGIQGPQQQQITLTAEHLGPDLRVQELTAQKQEIAQTPEGLKMLGTELESGYNRLNELIHQLQGNRTYTPQELLGIQGEMHELSLHIEVTTKVVSEAVSGIKQLMQQQV